MKRLMLRDHEIVTIPVSDEVQSQFEDFVRDHMDELRERLSVDPANVGVPRLREVLFEEVHNRVYDDEEAALAEMDRER